MPRSMCLVLLNSRLVCIIVSFTDARVFCPENLGSPSSNIQSLYVGSLLCGLPMCVASGLNEAKTNNLRTEK